MMVVGEYAVLDGAEAIVSAVNRRAVASWRDDETAVQNALQDVLPPEAQAARKLAAERLGSRLIPMELDVSSMNVDGRKLGLGSSAAGAAVAAGAVHAAAGQDLADDAVRAAVLQAALDGHRSVAPRGSGADVAAAVLGGHVRFRRLGDGIETHAIDWPAALHVRVVWTGKSARTSELLERVDALAARDAASHRGCMGALAERSEQFVSAMLDDDVPALIEGTDAYAEAMAELGRAAGAPIETEEIARVRQLARQAGGAAKASGAGGGDVVLALFPSADAAGAFEAACSAAGVELLSIELGAAGVRIEQ
jgi:phosphomevalonate kinase